MARSKHFPRLVAPLLLAVFVDACSSEATSNVNSDASTDSNREDATQELKLPPSKATIAPGILREIFWIDTASPPANPISNEQTPTMHNRVRVVRYRPEAESIKAVKGIVVAMPGFLAGATAFYGIAKALVRRGYEVWAIDRRSNGLEDTWGSDLAEIKRDPSLAKRYYVDLQPVEGKTFAGFLDGTTTKYMSEWGLEVAIEDLRAVIHKVPEAQRKQRMILLGHSMGATVVEAYAAWDFAGKKGSDELAALLLVDGVTGKELDPPTSFSETDYRKGSSSGAFGGSPGIEGIRSGKTIVSLPFVGVEIFEKAERAAILTYVAPSDKLDKTTDLASSIALFMGLSVDKLPPMTNQAAFGFVFDNESAALSIAAVSMGKPKGGAVESYNSLFGSSLKRPSDLTASYEWQHYNQSNPVEHTSLEDNAKAWFEGPGLNLAEWYFPARLSLDCAYVGSLNIEKSDWRFAFGLKAKHGAQIDAPVLAVAAQLTVDSNSTPPSAKRYEKLKAMLANTPIGTDRPLSGTSRSDSRAYDLWIKANYAHVDPTMAADEADGKVYYDALDNWLTQHLPKENFTPPVL